jgi:hypothetical protein
MPFDFELTFTGLCVLTLKGDREKPDEVDVLLVRTTEPQEHTGHSGRTGTGGNGHGNGNGQGPGNGHDAGHRHLPRLTYRAKDLTARSTTSRAHRLVPGIDGLQLGQRDLEDKGMIEVKALDRPSGMSTAWGPSIIPEILKAPRTPTEEVWLNWVPSFHIVAPAAPKPKGDLPFLNLEKTQVTAWAKLTQGNVEAAEVARGRINGDYLIWDFTPQVGGEVDRKTSQALAGRIVLRMENLEKPVQIRLPGDDGLVELDDLRPISDRQEQYLVSASITNLPDLEIPPSERLEHFAQYFSLFDDFPPSGIRIPEASDRLDTTSSTFCPPGGHT